MHSSKDHCRPEASTFSHHLESISIFKESSQCQPPSVSTALQPFETCPFSPIRQLICHFLTSLPLLDEDEEQEESLVSERFILQQESKRVDEMLFLNCHEYREQSRKLQILIENIERVTGDLDRVASWAITTSQVNSRLTRLNSLQILATFESQFQQMNALNEDYREALTVSSAVHYYGEYLTSAIHHIIKHEKIFNTYPDKDLAEYVTDLKEVRDTVNALIIAAEREKFHLRQRVKHQSVPHEELSKVPVSRLPQLKQVHNMFYRLPPAILNAVSQIDLLHEKMKTDYIRFLKLYTEYDEIQQAKSKEGSFVELIESEKHRLSEHLKTNHNLIVKYERSPNYSSFLTFIKAKAHVSTLFLPSVKEIEQAIDFINRDYNTMFSKLCTQKGDVVVRQQVAHYSEVFHQANPGDQYNTVILHALSRMLQLR